MSTVTIQLSFDFADVDSYDLQRIEDAVRQVAEDAVASDTTMCDHCGQDIFDGIGAEVNVHGDDICADCAVNDHTEVDCELIPNDEVGCCDSCGDEMHLENAVIGRDGCGVYCCDYCVPAPSGLSGYHSVPRAKDTVTDADPYLLGIEIEKEDGTWRDELEDGAVELPTGWIPEEDSSLCSLTGFEIVTRAYNVGWNRGQMASDLESVADLLDADSSTACGGHITISRKGLTGAQMLDHIEPLCAMLCALYPSRLRNLFCRSRDKQECKGGEKYAPFRVMHDRLEIRIFPQIKNRAQLMRRIELVELFLNDDHQSIDWVAEFERGHVCRMFSDVYSPEQWQRKCELRAQFAHWFGTGEVAATIAPFMYGS